MRTSTPAKNPPTRTSDEGDKPGLKLAQEQGAAFQRTVEHMVKEVADGGGRKHAGEYIVGYAVEKAEGMYMLRDGELQWQEPEENNLHIEVVVSDAGDHRFIPGLSVHVTLIDRQGKAIGTHEQPFLWHPYLYHYGRNWKIPGGGEYTLRVHIDAPQFPRHDKINGKRFADSVDVEFAGITLKTGKEK